MSVLCPDCGHGDSGHSRAGCMQIVSITANGVLVCGCRAMRALPGPRLVCVECEHPLGMPDHSRLCGCSSCDVPSDVFSELR